jgi:hypothetical protein
MMGDAERTKDRQTDMQKVGARCVGHSGGDAKQPHCFLPLLISSLYTASFLYLFFKASLLYNSLKTCF